MCGLYDLGFVGRKWTFEKKVAGGSFCRVRLDRALATADWCTRFPSSRVSHLTAAASDHDPILLQWDWAVDRGRKRRAKKMFRYEVMWESHEEFGGHACWCLAERREGAHPQRAARQAHLGGWKP